MRNFKTYSFSRNIKFSLLVFLSLFTFSVSAQKDVLLYSTDFTDWGAMNNTAAGSDATFNVTLGGEGFIIGSRPTVDPTGTVCGVKGFIRNNSDSDVKLTFKPLDFISGGVVELLICPTTTSNTRQVIVSPADAVMVESPVPVPASSRYDRVLVGTSSTSLAGASTTVLDPAKVDTYLSGNYFAIGGDPSQGPFTVSYRLPATFTGTQTITIGKSDWHKDIAIAGLKVYTSVGTTPYVASTNYPKSPASGLVMTGAVGGAANSGVVSNSPVLAQLWNSNNDVVVSIEGTDASKFSLVGAATDGTLTIPNAQIKNLEKQIDVNFTPSVKAGVSSAVMKIMSSGVANPYYVTLTGITGGGAPQIVADTASLPFWTIPITKASQTLNVTGLNLTGDLQLSITGAGASRFSLSQSTISSSLAQSGVSVDISFLGDIVFGELDAVLVITSAGAQMVTVPLKGYTQETKPVIYKLDFAVDAPGQAYVNTSPGGTYFKQGTLVSVKVTPETGYKIDSWSDAVGTTSVKRSFYVSDLVNTDNGVPITIKMVLGVQDTTTYVVGELGLVGYVPTYTGVDGELVLTWSSVPNDNTTTDYVVTVYDMSGNEVGASQTVTNATSLTVSSLAPGAYYKYRVTTTAVVNSVTETYDTGKVGPFITTGTPTDGFKCGKE